MAANLKANVHATGSHKAVPAYQRLKPLLWWVQTRPGERRTPSKGESWLKDPLTAPALM